MRGLLTNPELKIRKACFPECLKHKKSLRGFMVYLTFVTHDQAKRVLKVLHGIPSFKRAGLALESKK
jgi:hypothetical protein